MEEDLRTSLNSKSGQTEKNTIYLAYGSNIDEMQMQERCPESVKREIIVLPRYEFFINGRGVATIRKQKEKCVYGVTYEISRDDEARLDRYEGVGKNIYRKEICSGMLIYIASDSSEGSPRNGYMEKIIANARKHMFPQEYIHELETWLSDKQCK